MAESRILALCGKGGVGKTSISALMIKILARDRGRRILAIDADPATGLAMSLGITVRRTVDDIRKDIISGIQNGEAQKNHEETLKRLDYEVFGALEEQEGYALLAIGRPEDEGCFCRVNSLLKDIIRDLAGKFDIVVIDGEAGIEQINRRVMKTVDRLVLVTDTSAKGVNVANTIAAVAKDKKAVDFKDICLIINRARNEAEVMDISKRTGLEIYGWLGDDNLIRDYDFSGKPLTGMPEASTSLNIVKDILKKMNVL